MTKDASYGVIPYYWERNTPVFLLIQHTMGHWSFPKGHPEPNETDIEVAQRELREEAGIDTIEIDQSKPFVEHYYWERQGELLDKQVTFFLGKVASPEVKIQPEEIRDYTWLPFEQAMIKLTHAETQTVLRSAYEHLRQSQPQEEG